MMTRTGPIALVTGAGGFIGGHLVASLLQDGYRVHALDKKLLENWHQVHDEARNTAGFLVRNIPKPWLEVADDVYHLAAEMGGIGFTSSNLVTCATNTVDTIHLLEGLGAGQRIFYSSTACVYPVHLQEQGGNVSLKESDVWPYDPDGAYGFEKLYGEMLMRWFGEERLINTVTARYHNVYGPHGDWTGGREKAPAALCRKVAIAKLTNQKSIKIWGDGEQTRSFMHVRDCVEGTRRLMEELAGTVEPVNLGSDEWVTINQLAGLISEIAGWHGKVRHDFSKPQGVRGRNSDNTLIRKLLNWEPSTALNDGLQDTYEWIENQVRGQL